MAEVRKAVTVTVAIRETFGDYGLGQGDSILGGEAFLGQLALLDHSEGGPSLHTGLRQLLVTLHGGRAL
mgnify:CR=1 FL=1